MTTPKIALVEQLLDSTGELDRQALDAHSSAAALHFAAAYRAAPQYFAQLADRCGIPRPPVERVPGRLGPYRISHLLGQGGMGSVYLAHRDDAQFEKVVAIKVMSRGIDDEVAAARFVAERQILANLVHPNIARLLDGGISVGQPYLVMDHVEGCSITDYCAKQHCSTSERLHLFRQICRAMSYAHGQLVVHLDLKPSNVLVEEDGSVKLLDFGIARTLESDLTSAPQQPTPLTQRYASPELLQGLPATTKADIYSLGVMLHELLTGTHPNDTDRAATPKTTGFVASKELIAIAHKAMSTKPEQRYASIDALVDELQRFEAHRPVTAIGSTPSYRTTKFLRRNRGYLLTAVLGIVLLSGLVYQYFQTSAAAAQAQREAQLAAEVSDFLLSLFKAANPMMNAGVEPSVKSLLDSGAQRLEATSLQDPEIRARLAQTIGQAYSALAHLDDAERMLLVAKATQAELLGSDDPSTLKTAVILATNFNRKGQYDKAETLLKETLFAQEQRYGVDAEVTIPTRNNLANAHSYQDELTEVLELNRVNARIARSRYGLDHKRTLDVLHSLAITHRLLGQYAQAEAIFEEIREPHESLRGPKHPNQIGMLMNLADLYSAQLRSRDAAALYAQAIKVSEDVLGNEHPTTNRARANFANLKRDLGDFTEARYLYREGIAGHRTQLGDVHPETLSAIANLAQLAVSEGNYDEAEQLLAEAHAGYSKTFDASHINRLDLMEQHIKLLAATGQTEARAIALQTLISLWRQRFAQTTPTPDERIRLANLLINAGDGSAALTQAEVALERATRVQPEHLRTLADAFAASNQPAQAVTAIRKAIEKLHPQAGQKRIEYQARLRSIELTQKVPHP